MFGAMEASCCGRVVSTACVYQMCAGSNPDRYYIGFADNTFTSRVGPEAVIGLPRHDQPSP